MKIFFHLFFHISVITCPEPSDVQYSQQIPARGPYWCGGHVTYLCNHGYKLQGDSTRQCQDNGTFSRRQAVCVKDDDVGGTLRWNTLDYELRWFASVYVTTKTDNRLLDQLILAFTPNQSIKKLKSGLHPSIEEKKMNMRLTLDLLLVR